MAGHADHGNNPAAWTGVVIVLIGFCVGAVFVVMAEPLGAAAGLGIVALGGVATLVLRSMGFGGNRPVTVPAPRQGAESASEPAKAKVSG